MTKLLALPELKDKVGVLYRRMAADPSAFVVTAYQQEIEQVIVSCHLLLQTLTEPVQLEAVLSSTGETLRELQTSLPWSDSYHFDFRSSPVVHKDFAHALLHVHKAGGKLAAAVEDAEHAGGKFNTEGVEKYLADLVICAVRMANTCPGCVIDLQNAVQKRLEEKNPAPAILSRDNRCVCGIVDTVHLCRKAFLPSAVHSGCDNDSPALPPYLCGHPEACHVPT